MRSCRSSLSTLPPGFPYHISIFPLVMSQIIIFSRRGSAPEIGNVAVFRACTCCKARRRYTVPERPPPALPIIYFFSPRPPLPLRGRALHLELQCCLRTGKHRLVGPTRRERRACKPQFYTRNSNFHASFVHAVSRDKAALTRNVRGPRRKKIKRGSRQRAWKSTTRDANVAQPRWRAN